MKTMKFVYQLKIILIIILAVLCAITLVNVLRKLRSLMLWRVNCWFCNHNSWVKLPERNSWTCHKCEQYNGFTKDGDYNKPLFAATEPAAQNHKHFHRSPKSLPKNGLCKMCNINQQLKVAQLANFVPMNERRFNEEIESYKVQLEKAYKLCSPCKKVLQSKLHKEKESLLGSKLLDSRTPEKKHLNKMENQNEVVRHTLNRVSMVIVTMLLLVVTFDCCKLIMTDEKLPRTITDMKQIVKSLLERIYLVVKMKALMAFPFLDSYFDSANHFINLAFDMKPKILTEYFINHDQIIDLTQQALGGSACILQILGHIYTIKIKYAYAIDLLLTIFVVTCLSGHSLHAPILLCLIKAICVFTILIIYNSSTVKAKTSMKIRTPPKKLKSLTRSVASMIDDGDSSAMDTDDDVSLHKFGLHSFTDSSNENMSQLNSTINSGRAFTPRSNDGIWSRPKLNSTFCVNSMMAKSPSSVSDNVFRKPSFDNYQKLSREDSDSELDESISSLCIGSPQKAKRKSNSIFSLRKFTATPSFVAPTIVSMKHTRPLISPSKLGHSTSWVAGGYWGSESERQIFNINGSRSSSQSSGFESQASSVNQRNMFSQPPSHEGSDCGEPDRANILMDRFQSSNISSCNYHVPQNFSRVLPPIYPQMQYNGHVHIPQPRFVQQNPNMYGFRQQPQSQQNSMFKTPGGSGIIKLPPVSPFSSH